jgi:hypothetical protein
MKPREDVHLNQEELGRSTFAQFYRIFQLLASENARSNNLKKLRP